MKALRPWIGCALLLLGSVCLAQTGQTDPQKLQGAWVGTIISADGNPPSAEEQQLKIKLVVTGSRYQVFEDDRVLMEGIFKLEPAQSPSAIDAVFQNGELKGALQKGIYEFKGDELMVNFATPGNDRPRSFATRPNSGEATIRYVRGKK